MTNLNISQYYTPLFKDDSKVESLEINDSNINILMVGNHIINLKIKNSTIGRVVFNNKLKYLTIIDSIIEEKLIYPHSLRNLAIKNYFLEKYAIHTLLNFNKGLRKLNIESLYLDNLRLPISLSSLELKNCTITHLNLNQRLRMLYLDECLVENELKFNNILSTLSISNKYGNENHIKLGKEFSTPIKLKSLSLENVNCESVKLNEVLETINLVRCANIQTVECNSNLSSLQIDKCEAIKALNLNNNLQSLMIFNLYLNDTSILLGTKLRFAIFSECNLKHIKVNNKLKSLYVSTKLEFPTIDKTAANKKLTAAFDLI